MPENCALDALALPDDSPVHELLRLCADAEPVRFHDEEFVVAPGEPGLDVYLLVRGSCLVEDDDATRERRPGHELAIIHGAPDSPVFVGEMAYLGGGYRTAAVRSALNTLAIRLKPAHVDLIIERLPFFTGILCRQFARRLAEANAALKRQHADSAMRTRTHIALPGDVVCTAGEPAMELFQLMDGTVVESRADGVDERKGGGDAPVFLEMRAYLRGGRYESTVQAKTRALIMAIDAASRLAVVRNFPEAALAALEPSA
ncbi:MAG TPA: cyclic nucleotide-binding domain-containing protein [Candidatus Hydrogenedentes bacterium]|nr:cyclic nucleotide-binding domain-containing protein [Candidatus Hydrogenedentota bacterium]